MNRGEFQNYKTTVQKLIGLAQSFAKSKNEESSLKQLEETALHLEKGQLFTVIAGEFKQGKSKFGNALLGEKDLFPVDVDITTALASMVSYGPEEKIFLGEKGSESRKRITRSEIPEYVTEKGNPNNVKTARLLTVETPNDKLKDGLVLVDTPGVGSLNIHHTEVTYAFLPNADVVLFISDAYAPLSANELKFIQERIWRYCKHIIFVVTKIDAVSDYRAIIESNREKLADTLKVPGESLMIFAVSSNCKATYELSQDPDDLTDSNFPAFETEMWRLLNQQRGSILIGRAVAELGAVVRDFMAPLKIELDTYSGKSKDELDAMEKNLQSALQRREALMKHGSEWQRQLSYGLEDVRKIIARQLDDRIDTVYSTLKSSLNDERVIANIASSNSISDLAGMLQRDLSNLGVDLTSESGDRVHSLYREMKCLTGLDISPFEFGELEVSAQEIDVRLKRETSRFDKVMTIFRESSFTRSAGATAGGVVGGILGTIVPGVGTLIGAALGGFLGGLAGTLAGVVRGVQRFDEMTRSQIRSEAMQSLEPVVRSVRKDLGWQIDDMFTKFSRDVRDDLLSQIERERDTLEKSAKAMHKARSATAAEVQRRTAELKAPLQQLTSIFEGAKRIAVEISKQVGDNAGMPRKPDTQPVGAASEN